MDGTSDDGTLTMNMPDGQEHVIEVYDLVSIEEWNNQIQCQIKYCENTRDINNLIDLLNYYLLSLNDCIGHKFAKDVFRHIQKFFTLYQHIGQRQKPEQYLDLMEDILTTYCNLEISQLNCKQTITERKAILCLAKRLIHMLNEYLLNSQRHILQVLLKLSLGPLTGIRKSLLNVLFLKTLMDDQYDRSDEAFCRHYILFQIWKHLRPQHEWPRMDRYVFGIFNRKPSCLQESDILSKIVKSDGTAQNFINSYFKYMKTKNHEMDQDVDVDLLLDKNLAKEENVSEFGESKCDVVGALDKNTIQDLPAEEIPSSINKDIINDITPEDISFVTNQNEHATSLPEKINTTIEPTTQTILEISTADPNEQIKTLQIITAKEEEEKCTNEYSEIKMNVEELSQLISKQEEEKGDTNTNQHFQTIVDVDSECSVTFKEQEETGETFKFEEKELEESINEARNKLLGTEVDASQVTLEQGEENTIRHCDSIVTVENVCDLICAKEENTKLHSEIKVVKENESLSSKDEEENSDRHSKTEVIVENVFPHPTTKEENAEQNTDRYSETRVIIENASERQENFLRLPIKKRKLMNLNEQETMEKEEEVSCPATPLISIAEVEALGILAKLGSSRGSSVSINAINNSCKSKDSSAHVDCPQLQSKQKEMISITTNCFSINNLINKGPTSNKPTDNLVSLNNLPCAVPESYDYNNTVSLKNELFSKILELPHWDAKFVTNKRMLTTSNEGMMKKQERMTEISYPATPMISIAEVEALNSFGASRPNFSTNFMNLTSKPKTLAERKEFPPLPNRYRGIPPILTDGFNINNHTYNYPIINYHMNNIPVPFINFPYPSYYPLPPLLLPCDDKVDDNKVAQPELKKEHNKQTRRKRKQ